ncbi:hypothetical protein [Paraburkholderia lacunae]|uniref:hypothetical protein n=1 Tax=Paraburkholderia lacunae TaxID=2211104 RepID=UPI001058F732|nr:hypothetical protein [Paraburkholderia lacunae]
MDHPAITSFGVFVIEMKYGQALTRMATPTTRKRSLMPISNGSSATYRRSRAHQKYVAAIVCRNRGLLSVRSPREAEFASKVV